MFATPRKAVAGRQQHLLAGWRRSARRRRRQEEAAAMRVLYLCYDGLLEPLIQSQVLAYLERLSRHHEITLVTFEKPADLGRSEEIAALRRRCAGSGIRRVARRYRHPPRLLAPLYDLAVFPVTAMRDRRRGRAAQQRGVYGTAFQGAGHGRDGELHSERDGYTRCGLRGHWYVGGHSRRMDHGDDPDHSDQ